MKSTSFSTLLSRKMTRREFLVYLGTLVVLLSGISGILKTLADPRLKTAKFKSSSGFGGGAYGG